MLTMLPLPKNLQSYQCQVLGSPCTPPSKTIPQIPPVTHSLPLPHSPKSSQAVRQYDLKKLGQLDSQNVPKNGTQLMQKPQRTTDRLRFNERGIMNLERSNCGVQTASSPLGRRDGYGSRRSGAPLLTSIKPNRRRRRRSSSWEGNPPFSCSFSSSSSSSHAHHFLCAHNTR